MKILQLCKKFPYPPKDGEIIAILNLSKGFVQAGHSVDILAINTHKHFFDISKLPTDLAEIINFYSIKLNTDVNAIDAFFNLFSSKSYHIERFNSNEYRIKLIKLLKENEYDVIQLEGLTMLLYADTIREFAPNSKIAFRAHNIEFEVWERLAANEKGLKKAYLNLLVKRLKKFELSHVNSADLLVPISSKDESYFKELGCKLPSFTVNASVDLDAWQRDESKIKPKSVCFLGAMDWMPNTEAMVWFVKKVWSEVIKQVPNTTFYIGGRSMNETVSSLATDSVKIIGEVDSAIDFMNENEIMVVPLLSGSGMRIKIIEAMSLGKAVVSTSIGAEGIAYTNEKDILIANEPKEFAEAIVRLLKEDGLTEKIGENAIALAQQKYEKNRLAADLIDFYKKHIS